MSAVNAPVHVVVFNKGNANEKTEVVKPLRTVGNRTLVAFIKGAGIDTRWVRSNRVVARDS